MFIQSLQDTPQSLTNSGSQSTTGNCFHTATNNGPTAFQTPPPGLPASIETLDDLFRDAGYSPPPTSKDQRLDEIVRECNDILSLRTASGKMGRFEPNPASPPRISCFQESTRVGLEEARQQCVSCGTRAMLCRIFAESKQNNALQAFLRNGGDESTTDPSEGNAWVKLVNRHPEWGDETESCYVLFTLNSFGQVIQPFLRFQTALLSKVRFVVSAATCILYYMLATTGTQQEEGIRQYGINIGRFMRNNFADEQILQTIFCDNGGYPEHILESLLTHSKPPGPGLSKTTTIKLHHDVSPQTSFETIRSTLKSNGPILVSDFQVFRSYGDASKTEFHGDWINFKDETCDALHAFLIVGVRKTIDGSMGGIQFLVQDSMLGRPFVGIGFDLLKTMGVKRLVQVEDDVVFHGTTKDQELDSIPIYLTSGSPRKPLSSEGSLRATDSCEACRSEDENDVGVKQLDIGWDLPAGTDYRHLVVYT